MDQHEFQPLSLLAAARRGDQQAARALWSSLSPRLLALAKELLTTSDPMDIVQGVFVSIIELPASRLREIKDLTAYLVIATRNASHNANRAAARHAGTTRSLADSMRLRREEGDAPNPTPLHGPLHAAISSLEPDLRELVLLKHVGGLTFDQLALCLNQNRGTLASRYQRAMDLLRRALNGDSPQRTDLPPTNAAREQSRAEARA